MELVERIAAGRTDLVSEHLESGGDPEVTDRHGTSILKWCAYYGDTSALRSLVQAGARIDGLGPNLDLNGAAFHGHWKLCAYLLESGADPNHPQPETAETPLHAAASNPGRPEFDVVVRVLLQHGADPGRKTTPGVETGCFMRDARTRGETPLHRAAAFGSAAMIKMLLGAGADPEQKDANGDTPLSWASWHCRPDSILRLLLFGPHRIHPDRDSAGDHGWGTSAMQRYLLGGPDHT